MPVSSNSNPVIELLSKHHNRAAFDCGVDGLTLYIRQLAGQDVKKKIAASFVLLGDTPSTIAGYYTLSSTNVDVVELPEPVVRKLPHYPIMPATLIGRLAVDHHYQGRGYGELLLVDALRRSLKLTEQIGSVAVIVDAKDDKAKSFYEHFQFIPLINYSHRLFLPMTVIQNYFTHE
ncbi:MAG: GNAT family N-acetyltransferase [Nitrospirae bacterium]|nr:GNAT family N-acetyltransferase [Nitrospirota bacterium]MBF0534020.1 GNAT family N-acetyltransferase [Nitrospirota bacterium]MBF0616179.1 GNAT family N-acetyltransferase [Nitrospirota bacterium]